MATGDADGPHLVPLLFHHNGDVLTFATFVTFANSRTVTKVTTTARARAAFGHQYDVVMIDGTMRIIEPDNIDPPIADTFAALLRGGPDRRRHQDSFTSSSPQLGTKHGIPSSSTETGP